MLADQAPQGRKGAHLLHSLRANPLWQQRMELLSHPGGISSFLSHVVSTVPRYGSLARLLDGRPPVLSDFPLVTRTDFVAHRDEFLAASWLQDAGSLDFETSGTTGPPLRVSTDLACWYEYAGGVYTEIARFIPGLLSSVSPGRTGVMLVTNKEHRERESIVLVSLRASLLRFRVIGRDAEEDRAVVRDLRSEPIPLLYGKSVYLLELAELDGRITPPGDRIRPEAILVSGENLFENDRRALQSWFGCRVHNAYISTEGGLIGMECEHRTGLHICTSRVTVELLGEGEKMLGEGSGEVVITNLTNWGMPVVRYRTGDFATLRHTACACGRSGPTIVDLPGREATHFDLEKGRVDPRCLDEPLESLPARQFQVTQVDGSGLHVKWIPDSPQVVAQEVEARIRSAIHNRLGHLPVTVEAIERITPKGGKIRRYVVVPAGV